MNDSLREDEREMRMRKNERGRGIMKKEGKVGEVGRDGEGYRNVRRTNFVGHLDFFRRICTFLKM